MADSKGSRGRKGNASRQPSVSSFGSRDSSGNSTGRKACTVCAVSFKADASKHRHRCRQCTRAVCGSCSKQRKLLPGINADAEALHVCTECFPLPVAVLPEHAPAVDVVIVTTANVERRTVLAEMKDVTHMLPGLATYLSRGVQDQAYVGTLAGHSAVLVQTSQGTGGVFGAQEVTGRAIDRYQPRIVLAPGIAAGLIDTKIGDAVVGRHVIDYEPERQDKKGGQLRWRLEKIDPKLVDLLAKGGKLTPGTVLSGGKLLDDKDKCDELRRKLEAFRKDGHSDVALLSVVEMEGRGIVAAARSRNVAAAVTKGVSDMGGAEGAKGKDDQVLAATRSIQGTVAGLHGGDLSGFSRPRAVRHLLPSRLEAGVFTGREDEMAMLEASIKAPQKIPAVLTGFGGIGKTTLAKEFVWRHREEYETVLWLRAETDATRTEDVLEAMRLLQLPVKDAKGHVKETPDLYHDLYAELRTHKGQWLVVLDNAVDAKSAAPFVPAVEGTAGRVLITSRNPGWSGKVPLASMNMKDAVQLLRRESQGCVTDSDTILGKLVHELGFMPLAIRVAATTLRDGLSVKEVLEGLGDGVLDDAEDAPADYPRSLPTIVRTALKGAPQSAKDILRAVAFVAPDRIPLTLLRSVCGGRSSEYRRGLRALRNSALLAEDDPGYVSVHRLVQRLVRNDVAAGKLVSSKVDGAAVAKLLAAGVAGYNSEVPATWPAVAQLVSHVSVIADLVKAEESAFALEAVGDYLAVDGQYRKSLSMHERSVSILVSLHGDDDARVAKAKVAVAWDQYRIGEFETAKATVTHALQAQIAALGKGHIETAESWRVLGVVSSEMADRKTALKAFETALLVSVAANGENDVATIPMYAHLGYEHRAQGNAAAAEQNFVRARDMSKSWGTTHSLSYIGVLSGLGGMANDAKDFKRAKEHFSEAVATATAIFGATHSQTAATQVLLATAMIQLGELSEANELLDAALATQVAVFGEGHVATSLTLLNLGSLAMMQKRFDDSKALLDNALNIQLSAHGKDHPDYLLVAEAQSRLEAARIEA